MATVDSPHIPQRIIYAKETVSLGTQFGPYPGKDAKERKFSEWMAFVGKAKSINEANLTSFISDGQKYFRSCKIIQPFETFMVWDDDVTGNKRRISSVEKEDSDIDLDANEASPQKMTLRNKKSPEASKTFDTKSMRIAKHIKTESTSSAESISSQASSLNTTPISIKPNLESPKTLNSSSSLSCPDCGERFETLPGLAFHRLLHGLDQQCATCGNKYTVQSNLHQHLLSHTSKKFSTCDQCFRYFDKEFDLTVRSHKACKTPLCSECESIIIVNREITIAKQISGELTCNYCGRVYFRKKSLKSHLNKHNSKYSCRKCNKVFGSYNSIKRHIGLHNFKPSNCETCGLLIANIAESQYHSRHCKRQSSMPTKNPVNGIKLKEESNISIASKIRNTRRSSRIKSIGSVIASERSDVSDEYDDTDDSSNGNSKDAEYFHCQLENNNNVESKNGNVTFNAGNERANNTSDKNIIEALKSHGSSSRCDDEVLLTRSAQKKTNIILASSNEAGNIESYILTTCNIPSKINDNNTNNLIQFDRTSSTDDVSNQMEIMELSNDLLRSIEVECDSTNETPVTVNSQRKKYNDCSVKITTLYNCPQCYKVYASIEGLAMHRFTHLTEQICAKCGTDFALHQQMKRHLLGHSAEDVNKCLKCYMLFGSAFNYRNCSWQNRALMCDDCDNVMGLNTDDLLMELKQNGRIKCKCGETFKSMRRFCSHFSTHRNEISCFVCEEWFLSYEEFLKHKFKCSSRGEPHNDHDYASPKNENHRILTRSVVKSREEEILDGGNGNNSFGADTSDRTDDKTENSNRESSKTLLENKNVVFHYECSECMRDFHTEAGSALHRLLHIEQFCMFCGDDVVQGFDFENDDEFQASLFCERCKVKISK